MRLFNLIGILGLYLISFFVEPCSLIRVTSDSLPFRYFVGFSLGSLERERYVLFDHGSQAIAKQIKGLPGDQIDIRNRSIYVHGENCGVIRSHSKSGRPFHPIQERVIPNGYIFVCGTHDESFDSRYEEFGLVEINNLRKSLWPIF